MNYLLLFIVILLFNLYWFLIIVECKWSNYKDLYNGSINIYLSIGFWLYALGGLVCGVIYFLNL